MEEFKKKCTFITPYYFKKFWGEYLSPLMKGLIIKIKYHNFDLK